MEIKNFLKFLGVCVVFTLTTELIFLFLSNLVILNPTFGLLSVATLSYPAAIFSLSASVYIIFKNNWRKVITTPIIFLALMIQPLIMFYLTIFISKYVYVGRILTPFFVAVVIFAFGMNLFFGILIQTQAFPPFDWVQRIYRGFDGTANEYSGTATEEEFLSLATMLNKPNAKPEIIERNEIKFCFVSPVENFTRAFYIPLVHLSFKKASNKLTVHTMHYSGFHAIPPKLDYFEPTFKKLNLVKTGTSKFSDGIFYIDKEHPKFGKSSVFIILLLVLDSFSVYFTQNYITTSKILPANIYFFWQTTNNLISDNPIIALLIALIMGYILRDLPKASEIVNRIKDKIREA